MSARRRARPIDRIGVTLLSALLLVWTLLPIYNIIRVSMQEKEEVLSTSVYPIAPSSHAFSVVFHQAFWLLETFWNQMSNSFFIVTHPFRRVEYPWRWFTLRQLWRAGKHRS